MPPIVVATKFELSASDDVISSVDDVVTGNVKLKLPVFTRIRTRMLELYPGVESKALACFPDQFNKLDAFTKA